MAAGCVVALEAYRKAVEGLTDDEMQDLTLILEAVSASRLDAENTPGAIPVLRWEIAPMLLAVFQLLG